MQDILAFAVEMEQDGIEYYEELAQKAPHEGLAKIFNTLADEERKHITAINELMKENPWRPQSRAVSEAENVFQQLQDEGFTFDNDASAQQQYLSAYQHAWEVEKKSRDFYQEQAESSDEITVKELLSELADQEAKHMVVMETLMKVVERRG